MARPSVVITGVAGHLGRRLLAELADYEVIGIDLNPPDTPNPLHFERMDLAQEKSCRDLFHLIREVRPAAFVHLAFVVDPVRSGVLDPKQMWQVNVGGTARVMEALAEANRDQPIVSRFICTGSAASYGPMLPEAVPEDHPLGAHTLTYAVHKMECDQVIRHRAPEVRDCSSYLLRPCIFAGSSIDNYILGAFRGTAFGLSKRAARMRRQGKRLPCLLPYGDQWLTHSFQFVHLDDMARLIAYLVRKPEPDSQRVTVLNVAGRGEPLSVAHCLSTASTKLVRVPGLWALRRALEYFWATGLCSIPPEAAPYLVGQFLVDTTRLQNFLGIDYEHVIRQSCVQAFADSFSADAKEAESVAQTAPAQDQLT